MLPGLDSSEKTHENKDTPPRGGGVNAVKKRSVLQEIRWLLWRWLLDVLASFTGLDVWAIHRDGGGAGPGVLMLDGAGFLNTQRVGASN